MSLENKSSNLSYTGHNFSKSGKDVSRMGTLFKSPSRISDIERTSIPVDDGTKSKINKTIPVEKLPKKEELPLNKKESMSEPVQKLEKKEFVQPVIKNIQLNSSGSSKSGSKL